jgi:hypothetical protein
VAAPQSWHRYAYALNNPLKYSDAYGLYVYDSSVTPDQRKKFEQGLKDAEKARDSFKKGSTEYQKLDRAIRAYGAKGVDNGVTIKFGETKGGGPGGTEVGLHVDSNGHKVATSDNPTGQNIVVTLDPKKHGDSYDYALNVAHEGSHVADGSDVVGALPADLTTAAASAILGGPLNRTQYATETSAYEVSSFAAQGLGLSSVKYEGHEIWNSGWKEADRATKRSAGIDKFLADPAGRYNVTSSSQGRKLIE